MPIIVGVIVAVFAAIFFFLAIIVYIYFKFILLAKGVAALFSPFLALTAAVTMLGSNLAIQTITVPTGTKVNCSGVDVPAAYLPTIKQAADQYLGGDMAKLVAVISFESSFNPVDMSSTGAVGLGQFTYTTALDYRAKGPFKGLPLTYVPRADHSSKHTVTPAERNAFRTNYASSGRFNPQASIMAVAMKLRDDMKLNGGNFRQAYGRSYSTEGDVVAGRMMAIYNKIQGCKSFKAPPGQLGVEAKKAAKSK